MKLKRAFKLKQVKIHKKLNDYLKKYIDDKKIYNDLLKYAEPYYYKTSKAKKERFRWYSKKH